MAGTRENGQAWPLVSVAAKKLEIVSIR